MGYKELLSEMVNESHMTLREIADRAREKGINLDPSYISKLQTGKQPPASEEISRVIAEVCGVDPDYLIWEGYMEKAPDVIREFVDKTLEFFRATVKVFMKSQVPEEYHDFAISMLESISPLDFLRQLNDTESLGFTPEEDKVVVNDDLGAINQIMVSVNSPEMMDDSMEPIIPKGAKVTLKRQMEYNNGDIVLVEISESETLIRKVIRTDEKVIFVPANNKFETLILSEGSYNILGKVDSVSIKL